jgi:hypothetical protein
LGISAIIIYKSDKNIASIFVSFKVQINKRKVRNLTFLLLLRGVLILNNWLNALFNTGRMTGRMQPFLNMFGRRRRRNNRGMLWGSLLSLGLSAAAYGLTRNRNRNMARPLQNLMNNTRMGNFQKPNMAGLTEFAEELTPNKNPLNNNPLNNK